MQFPHLKIVIPTAPVQPYTPLNGEVCKFLVTLIIEFVVVNIIRILYTTVPISVILRLFEIVYVLM